MKRAMIALAFILSVSSAQAQHCPNCVQPAQPVAQAPVNSLDGGKYRDRELKPGDVWIPPQWRVRNTQGNCVWSAVETVGRQSGLKSLEGIKERAVQNGWHGAFVDNVELAFKDAKIPYDVTKHKEYSLLGRAVKNGTGAYIQIDGNSHAVVLVGIDSDSVRIVDNNGPPVVQTWTRASFDRRWSGVACCPRLFPRIFRFRHEGKPLVRPYQNDAGPNPNAHPPLNPAHPEEKSDALPDPEEKTPPPPPPPPAKPVPGPQGPQGPPGRDGKDADNSAVLSAINALGARLDASDKKNDARLAALEAKVEDLSGAVRTRFVPGGK